MPAPAKSLPTERVPFTIRGSLIILLLAAVVCTFASCRKKGGAEPKAERQVVVYTALDEIFSRPVLDDFEKKTGIEVKAVYDTEASKTAGLAARIAAEKDAPRCDVFWNNEILHSLRLKKKGLTQPHASPSAEGIPKRFRDPEAHWTGFAARARGIVYNTERLKADEAPKRVADLADKRWHRRIAVALPLFGTTCTHCCALAALHGKEKATGLILDLQRNGDGFATGNSHACRLTAAGKVDVCLTDTDDYLVHKAKGAPIDIVFPDQDGEGCLVIPNSVCLIRGAPHTQEGKELIDYLLSPEVEITLGLSPAGQLPVREELEREGMPFRISKIKSMNVPWDDVLEQSEWFLGWARENLLPRQ